MKDKIVHEVTMSYEGKPMITVKSDKGITWSEAMFEIIDALLVLSAREKNDEEYGGEKRD